uniref:Uncharacterized protein n=1 Tax=Romanomermis culicivorax TaxID=13658 RepID=A0A915JRD9_ROMCU
MATKTTSSRNRRQLRQYRSLKARIDFYRPGCPNSRNERKRDRFDRSPTSNIDRRLCEPTFLFLESATELSDCGVTGRQRWPTRKARRNQIRLVESHNHKPQGKATTRKYFRFFSFLQERKHSSRHFASAQSSPSGASTVKPVLTITRPLEVRAQTHSSLEFITSPLVAKYQMSDFLNVNRQTLLVICIQSAPIGPSSKGDINKYATL